jgi:hypothetical protein
MAASARCQAALRSDAPGPLAGIACECNHASMSLDGPSRRIISEPIEHPEPVEQPEREVPAPRPQPREPEPAPS